MTCPINLPDPRVPLAVLLSVALPLAAIPAAAQELRPRTPGTAQGVPAVQIGPDNRPRQAILPQDDDFAYLADRDLRRDGFDRLRHVEVGDDAFLSFGANLRYKFRQYDDFNWGQPPGSTPFHGTRANVSAGLTLGERFRLFAALKHGDLVNGDAPASPAEVDSVDLHMAFGEVAFGDAFGLAVNDVLVRVGRQELHYGAGRFISIRQGPNVRDDYDGVLLRARLPDDSVTDALAFFEVEDAQGGFDNGTDADQGFWGVYHSRPLGEAYGKPVNLDAFYIGYKFVDELYATTPGPGREVRHTLGLRPWVGGPPDQPGLSGDVELNVQFGELETAAGDLDIFAYTLTGQVQYGLDAAWSPVLRTRFGLTSGDDDPDDGTLGTYRAPHPPGRYFGETTPLGPGNLMGFTTELELSPGDRLTVVPAALFFWRLSDDDGIYNPPGLPIRGADGGDRFVGWELNVIGSYALTEQATLVLEVGHFFAGGYLEDNPPDDDISFALAEISFAF